MSDFVDITQGDGPVVLGLPHTGVDVPPDIRERLNDNGRALTDTDWHVHDLYAGLLDNVTTVRTRIHRYVIDVNRSPDGGNLYPGQNTTSLCPLTDFDGTPIYETGAEPDDGEVTRRRDMWHEPYHAALNAELNRVRGLHGRVVLYDCHSIRSRIPFLFDGCLPDFNIGTFGGQSCARSIEAAVADIVAKAEGYSHVINGRFEGGWTTRHYGRPKTGKHAIQMELAQSTYLSSETPPWSCDSVRANRLRRPLAKILRALNDWKST